MFLAWMLCALLWLSPLPAWAQAAPALRTIDLDISGNTVRLNAGSVVGMHPDQPFRVVRASTDAWLDMGLDYRLKGYASFDLRKPHTLRQIMGEMIYEKDSLPLEVFKDDTPVGSITLLVQPSSLDWLRRAQQSPDPADKIRYMKKVADLSPDDELVFQSLLDLMLDNGRYAQAEELISGRLQRVDDPGLQRQLGDLYLKQDKFDKAAALFSKLRAESPDDVELARNLALSYLRLHRLAEAAPALERLAALEKGPERRATLLRLAETYEEAAQPDKALEAMSRAAAAGAPDARLQLRLADMLEAQDRPEEALTALQKAVDADPADITARKRLAKALLEAGDAEAALAQYQALERITPDDPVVLINLAGLYQQRGDRRALTDVYRRLYALNPGDPDLCYNLALLQNEAKQYDEALATLEQGLTASPGDVDMLELRFEAQCGLERYAQAVATARELVELGQPDKMATLIYPTLSRHAPDELAELLDKAQAQAPADTSLAEMRAALALEMERPAKAIEVLRGAWAAKPDDWAMAMRLAQLLEAEGELEGALEVYGKVVDGCDHCPRADDAYLNLKTRLLGRKKTP